MESSAYVIMRVISSFQMPQIASSIMCKFNFVPFTYEELKVKY